MQSDSSLTDTEPQPGAAAPEDSRTAMPTTHVEGGAGEEEVPYKPLRPTTIEIKEQPKKTEGSASFLRAARAGNLDKVLEFLKAGTDINTCNANGLNALHLASKEGHAEVVRELLKRGANVDSATKKGNTALHIAALAGQDDIVKVLVDQGANVNVQSQNGFTPLYMAAQENHDRVVTFMLAHGANQSLATEDGFTPLAVALQQGHDKVVALLLENDTRGRVRLPALHIAAKKDDTKAAALLLQNEHNPDVTSKSGFTPLHIAAHYGNENIGRMLLEKGSNVNYQARHNITPLHVAAKWGRSNMATLLLAHGAVLDCRTRDLLTPLHCAARSGHDTVVDLLLEKGAPISSKTKNGLSPLHMAAQGDHVDSARILLQHRAPVDEVTVDYLTPLHVAAHCGHVRVAKLLLDAGGDPNARALNGFTPLHIACKKNRIKVVELLLKYNAAIEATTESGLTPLHVAAFMGCMNIVIYLIQHNANPDTTTVRGETPLHLAARANQTDIVRILLRNGASVDARAREQQTPLHIASRLGNTDIVVQLLQHGAQVDAATKDQYTPLHIAAKEGQEEVGVILLDHNAPISVQTKKGFTPLHLAAKYGNINVARLLLEKGAGVDELGKNQVTPLHVASHYDHQNVALLLLEQGASPHAAAKNGYTPLHIAAKKNQMDIATTLVDYGANTNAESKAGFTPLHLGAQEGHAEMVNLLVKNGAHPNAKAKNGLTPMHLCAQEDRVNVATSLVKQGAEIDPQTKAGYSPLHVACHFGQVNMVRFLLQNGAQVDTTTRLGYTPLHQAAQQGHAIIIKILLESGASPNAITSQGQTPLAIAQKLGYVSVVETLRTVTETTVITETTTVTEERYKVQAPETMQETFISDSEDEGDVAHGTTIPRSPFQAHEDAEQGDSRTLSPHSPALLHAFMEGEKYSTPDRTAVDGTGSQSSSKLTSFFRDLLGKGPRATGSKASVSTISNADSVSVQMRTAEEISPVHALGDDLRGFADDGAHPMMEKSFEQENLESIIQKAQAQPLQSEAYFDDKYIPDNVDIHRAAIHTGAFRRKKQRKKTVTFAPNDAHRFGHWEVRLRRHFRMLTRSQTCTARVLLEVRRDLEEEFGVDDEQEGQDDDDDPDCSFLISFLVDARGGAMRGCRHSGVRVIVPPRKAPMPMRITCRYLRKDRLANPPPLSEGEALASRVLEMGPAGAKFLGPVILEIPHFASLRGHEREIIILRSDDGEHWKEHQLEATEDAVQEVLNQSFDPEELSQLEDLQTTRITRILTNDFPQYFAIITRIRQEVHAVGPEGGMITSTVVPQVQAVFPEGALTKTIKVSVQAQPIPQDLVTRLHGNRVAVSPVVTVEPRRRKFHKPITLTIPLPQAANRSMITQYQGQGQEPPTLRLLCSITGGQAQAQWEDITGTTQLNFVNDTVSFTTTVSARFWLMDCQTPREAAKMGQEVYNDAVVVPFMAKFVVFARRTDHREAYLRCFCMTDDKEDKTLEKQEHFVEIAKSRDVEVLTGKQQFLEFAGNLVPVTKSGDQLSVGFMPFQENRLPFAVRLREVDESSSGRIAFMREHKQRDENLAPQHPICTLNIILPEVGAFADLPTATPPSSKRPTQQHLLTLDKKYAHLRMPVQETIHKADIRLSDIARELGDDWSALAHILGLPESDVQQIRDEYEGQEALVTLRIWFERAGRNATGNALERALREIGREDIIRKCMFNVETVTSQPEVAAAKRQLEEPSYEDDREPLRTAEVDLETLPEASEPSAASDEPFSSSGDEHRPRPAPRGVGKSGLDSSTSSTSSSRRGGPLAETIVEERFVEPETEDVVYTQKTTTVHTVERTLSDEQAPKHRTSESFEGSATGSSEVSADTVIYRPYGDEDADTVGAAEVESQLKRFASTEGVVEPVTQGLVRSKEWVDLRDEEGASGWATDDGGATTGTEEASGPESSFGLPESHGSLSDNVFETDSSPTSTHSMRHRIFKQAHVNSGASVEVDTALMSVTTDEGTLTDTSQADTVVEVRMAEDLTGKLIAGSLEIDPQSAPTAVAEGYEETHEPGVPEASMVSDTVDDVQSSGELTDEPTVIEAVIEYPTETSMETPSHTEASMDQAVHMEESIEQPSYTEPSMEQPAHMETMERTVITETSQTTVTETSMDRTSVTETVKQLGHLDDEHEAIKFEPVAITLVETQEHVEITQSPTIAVDDQEVQAEDVQRAPKLSEVEAPMQFDESSRFQHAIEKKSSIIMGAVSGAPVLVEEAVAVSTRIETVVEEQLLEDAPVLPEDSESYATAPMEPRESTGTVSQDITDSELPELPSMADTVPPEGDAEILRDQSMEFDDSAAGPFPKLSSEPQDVSEIIAALQTEGGGEAPAERADVPRVDSASHIVHHHVDSDEPSTFVVPGAERHDSPEHQLASATHAVHHHIAAGSDEQLAFTLISDETGPQPEPVSVLDSCDMVLSVTQEPREAEAIVNISGVQPPGASVDPEFMSSESESDDRILQSAVMSTPSEASLDVRATDLADSVLQHETSHRQRHKDSSASEASSLFPTTIDPLSIGPIGPGESSLSPSLPVPCNSAVEMATMGYPELDDAALQSKLTEAAESAGLQGDEEGLPSPPSTPVDVATVSAENTKESSEEGYIDEHGNVVVEKRVTRVVTTTRTVIDDDGMERTETFQQVREGNDDFEEPERADEEDWHQVEIVELQPGQAYEPSMDEEAPSYVEEPPLSRKMTWPMAHHVEMVGLQASSGVTVIEEMLEEEDIADVRARDAVPSQPALSELSFEAGGVVDNGQKVDIPQPRHPVTSNQSDQQYDWHVGQSQQEPEPSSPMRAQDAEPSYQSVPVPEPVRHPISHPDPEPIFRRDVTPPDEEPAFSVKERVERYEETVRESSKASSKSSNASSTGTPFAQSEEAPRIERIPVTESETFIRTHEVSPAEELVVEERVREQRRAGPHGTQREKEIRIQTHIVSKTAIASHAASMYDALESELAEELGEDQPQPLSPKLLVEETTVTTRSPYFTEVETHEEPELPSPQRSSLPAGRSDAESAFESSTEPHYGATTGAASLAMELSESRIPDERERESDYFTADESDRQMPTVRHVMQEHDVEPSSLFPADTELITPTDSAMKPLEAESSEIDHLHSEILSTDEAKSFLESSEIDPTAVPSDALVTALYDRLPQEQRLNVPDSPTQKVGFFKTMLFAAAGGTMMLHQFITSPGEQKQQQEAPHVEEAARTAEFEEPPAEPSPTEHEFRGSPEAVEEVTEQVTEVMEHAEEAAREAEFEEPPAEPSPTEHEFRESPEAVEEVTEQVTEVMEHAEEAAREAEFEEPPAEPSPTEHEFRESPEAVEEVTEQVTKVMEHAEEAAREAEFEEPPAEPSPTEHEFRESPEAVEEVTEQVTEVMEHAEEAAREAEFEEPPAEPSPTEHEFRESPEAVEEVTEQVTEVMEHAEEAAREVEFEEPPAEPSPTEHEFRESPEAVEEVTEQVTEVMEHAEEAAREAELEEPPAEPSPTEHEFRESPEAVEEVTEQVTEVMEHAEEAAREVEFEEPPAEPSPTEHEFRESPEAVEEVTEQVTEVMEHAEEAAREAELEEPPAEPSPTEHEFRESPEAVEEVTEQVTEVMEHAEEAAREAELEEPPAEPSPTEHEFRESPEAVEEVTEQVTEVMEHAEEAAREPELEDSPIAEATELATELLKLGDVAFQPVEAEAWEMDMDDLHAGILSTDEAKSFLESAEIDPTAVPSDALVTALYDRLPPEQRLNVPDSPTQKAGFFKTMLFAAAGGTMMLHQFITSPGEQKQQQEAPHAEEAAREAEFEEPPAEPSPTEHEFRESPEAVEEVTEQVTEVMEHAEEAAREAEFEEPPAEPSPTEHEFRESPEAVEEVTEQVTEVMEHAEEAAREAESEEPPAEPSQPDRDFQESQHISPEHASPDQGSPEHAKAQIQDAFHQIEDLSREMIAPAQNLTHDEAEHASARIAHVIQEMDDFTRTSDATPEDATEVDTPEGAALKIAEAILGMEDLSRGIAITDDTGTIENLHQNILSADGTQDFLDSAQLDPSTQPSPRLVDTLYDRLPAEQRLNVPDSPTQKAGFFKTMLFAAAGGTMMLHQFITSPGEQKQQQEVPHVEEAAREAEFEEPPAEPSPTEHEFRESPEAVEEVTEQITEVMEHAEEAAREAEFEEPPAEPSPTEHEFRESPEAVEEVTEQITEVMEHAEEAAREAEFEEPPAEPSPTEHEVRESPEVVEEVTEQITEVMEHAEETVREADLEDSPIVEATELATEILQMDDVVRESEFEEPPAEPSPTEHEFRGSPEAVEEVTEQITEVMEHAEEAAREAEFEEPPAEPSPTKHEFRESPEVVEEVTEQITEVMEHAEEAAREAEFEEPPAKPSPTEHEFRESPEAVEEVTEQITEVMEHAEEVAREAELEEPPAELSPTEHEFRESPEAVEEVTEQITEVMEHAEEAAREADLEDSPVAEATELATELLKLGDVAFQPVEAESWEMDMDDLHAGILSTDEAKSFLESAEIDPTAVPSDALVTALYERLPPEQHLNVPDSPTQKVGFFKTMLFAAAGGTMMLHQFITSPAEQKQQQEAPHVEEAARTAELEEPPAEPSPTEHEFRGSPEAVEEVTEQITEVMEHAEETAREADLEDSPIAEATELATEILQMDDVVVKSDEAEAEDRKEESFEADSYLQEVNKEIAGESPEEHRVLAGQVYDDALRSVHEALTPRSEEPTSGRDFLDSPTADEPTKHSEVTEVEDGTDGVQRDSITASAEDLVKTAMSAAALPSEASVDTESTRPDEAEQHEGYVEEVESPVAIEVTADEAYDAIVGTDDLNSYCEQLLDNPDVIAHIEQLRLDPQAEPSEKLLLTLYNDLPEDQRDVVPDSPTSRMNFFKVALFAAAGGAMKLHDFLTAPDRETYSEYEQTVAFHQVEHSPSPRSADPSTVEPLAELPTEPQDAMMESPAEHRHVADAIYDTAISEAHADLSARTPDSSVHSPSNVPTLQIDGEEPPADVDVVSPELEQTASRITDETVSDVLEEIASGRASVEPAQSDAVLHAEVVELTPEETSPAEIYLDDPTLFAAEYDSSTPQLDVTEQRLAQLCEQAQNDPELKQALSKLEQDPSHGVPEQVAESIAEQLSAYDVPQSPGEKQQFLKMALFAAAGGALKLKEFLTADRTTTLVTPEPEMKRSYEIESFVEAVEHPEILRISGESIESTKEEAVQQITPSDEERSVASAVDEALHKESLHQAEKDDVTVLEAHSETTSVTSATATDIAAPTSPVHSYVDSDEADEIESTLNDDQRTFVPRDQQERKRFLKSVKDAATVGAVGIASLFESLKREEPSTHTETDDDFLERQAHEMQDETVRKASAELADSLTSPVDPVQVQDDLVAEQGGSETPMNTIQYLTIEEFAAITPGTMQRLSLFLEESDVDLEDQEPDERISYLQRLMLGKLTPEDMERLPKAQPHPMGKFQILARLMAQMRNIINQVEKKFSRSGSQVSPMVEEPPEITIEPPSISEVASVSEGTSVTGTTDSRELETTTSSTTATDSVEPALAEDLSKPAQALCLNNEEMDALTDENLDSLIAEFPEHDLFMMPEDVDEQRDYIRDLLSGSMASEIQLVLPPRCSERLSFISRLVGSARALLDQKDSGSLVSDDASDVIQENSEEVAAKTAYENEILPASEAEEITHADLDQMVSELTATERDLLPIVPDPRRRLILAAVTGTLTPEQHESVPLESVDKFKFLTSLAGNMKALLKRKKTASPPPSFEPQVSVVELTRTEAEQLTPGDVAMLDNQLSPPDRAALPSDEVSRQSLLFNILTGSASDADLSSIKLTPQERMAFFNRLFRNAKNLLNMRASIEGKIPSEQEEMERSYESVPVDGLPSLHEDEREMVDLAFTHSIDSDLSSYEKSVLPVNTTARVALLHRLLTGEATQSDLDSLDVDLDDKLPFIQRLIRKVHARLNPDESATEEVELPDSLSPVADATAEVDTGSQLTLLEQQPSINSIEEVAELTTSDYVRIESDLTQREMEFLPIAAHHRRDLISKVATNQTNADTDTIVNLPTNEKQGLFSKIIKATRSMLDLKQGVVVQEEDTATAAPGEQIDDDIIEERTSSASPTYEIQFLTPEEFAAIRPQDLEQAVDSMSDADRLLIPTGGERTSYLQRLITGTLTEDEKAALQAAQAGQSSKTRSRLSLMARMVSSVRSLVSKPSSLPPTPDGSPRKETTDVYADREDSEPISDEIKTDSSRSETPTYEMNYLTAEEFARVRPADIRELEQELTQEELDHLPQNDQERCQFLEKMISGRLTREEMSVLPIRMRLTFFARMVQRMRNLLQRSKSIISEKSSESMITSGTSKDSTEDVEGKVAGEGDGEPSSPRVSSSMMLESLERLKGSRVEGKRDDSMDSISSEEMVEKPHGEDLSIPEPIIERLSEEEADREKDEASLIKSEERDVLSPTERPETSETFYSADQGGHRSTTDYETAQTSGDQYETAVSESDYTTATATPYDSAASGRTSGLSELSDVSGAETITIQEADLGLALQDLDAVTVKSAEIKTPTETSPPMVSPIHSDRRMFTEAQEPDHPLHEERMGSEGEEPRTMPGIAEEAREHSSVSETHSDTHKRLSLDDISGEEDGGSPEAQRFAEETAIDTIRAALLPTPVQETTPRVAESPSQESDKVSLSSETAREIEAGLTEEQRAEMPASPRKRLTFLQRLTATVKAFATPEETETVEEEPSGAAAEGLEKPEDHPAEADVELLSPVSDEARLPERELSTESLNAEIRRAQGSTDRLSVSSSSSGSKSGKPKKFSESRTSSRGSRRSSHEENPTFQERITPPLELSWTVDEDGRKKSQPATPLEELKTPDIVPESTSFQSAALEFDAASPQKSSAETTSDSPFQSAASAGPVTDLGTVPEESVPEMVHSPAITTDSLQRRAHRFGSSSNVSESSLAEFERLEKELLAKGGDGSGSLSGSEPDAARSNNGSLRRKLSDGSSSSLNDFERLEQEIQRQCDPADVEQQQLQDEVRQLQSEVMQLSDIHEDPLEDDRDEDGDVEMVDPDEIKAMMEKEVLDSYVTVEPDHLSSASAKLSSEQQDSGVGDTAERGVPTVYSGEPITELSSMSEAALQGRHDGDADSLEEFEKNEAAMASTDVSTAVMVTVKAGDPTDLLQTSVDSLELKDSSPAADRPGDVDADSLQDFEVVEQPQTGGLATSDYQSTSAAEDARPLHPAVMKFHETADFDSVIASSISSATSEAETPALSSQETHGMLSGDTTGTFQEYGLCDEIGERDSLTGDLDEVLERGLIGRVREPRTPTADEPPAPGFDSQGNVFDPYAQVRKPLDRSSIPFSGGGGGGGGGAPVLPATTTGTTAALVDDSFASTLTTYETSQMAEDGSMEVITRTVTTRVTDPTEHAVRFTGAESQAQLVEYIQKLRDQDEDYEEFETVDEMGNVTRTVIRRLRARPADAGSAPHGLGVQAVESSSGQQQQLSPAVASSAGSEERHVQ